MMAYDTAELEKKALAAIKRHKLIYLEEMYSFLPCSESTAKNHKLPELPSIKKAIEENKVKGKLSSRRKWAKSDNPTLQIAYYKLMATDEEFRRLATSNIDHTTGGDKINRVQVEIVNRAEPITSEDDINENI